MSSPKRTNLISLLALLLLVAIVAVTPETRQGMARVADWIEGVRQERAEIRRREAEQESRNLAAAVEAAQEARQAAEANPAPLPPPHTFLDEDGLYQPDPGYGWVDGDPNSGAVEWRPGSLHPDDPRVVASSEPDQWSPAPGYEWVEAKGVDDLRVEWKPGKPHSIFGHVLAAEKEGEWRPAPGYAWTTDDPNDLTVVPEGGN